MKRKNNNKSIIRLAMLISLPIVGFVAAFTFLVMRNSNPPVPAETTTVHEDRLAAKAPDADNSYSLPSRLVIPKINVDTSIAQMGLTESGDMEAPATDEESGWYKYGPHPGNTGSAVIAGHLGVNNRAVFSQLSLLEKGDTVSVTDDRGQTASFIVTGTRMYGNDAAPSEVFTSTSGAHLNLITCEGSWDESNATYAERLVVFTDRVD